MPLPLLALAGGAALGTGLASYFGSRGATREAQRGAERAAGQFRGLAGEQRGYQEQGLDRALGQFQGLGDMYKTPGAFESYVGGGGAESGLGQYYDRIMKQNTDALNAQYAASGGLGSGARMTSIGNMQGALGAQRARDLAGLMAQSQQFGMGRLGGLGDLAGRQAGLTQQAYGLGGQMYGQGMGEAIGAEMGGSLYGAQRKMALPNAFADAARTGLGAYSLGRQG
jgi:hypothetical protein